ncbi:threonine dehydratase [Marchantia polymorpha subsp. ruderalis]|uniref:Serine racemase n=2 Tax=Marchantia polymorpha TaxID=3197 RepID=A0AAF6B9E8_MARPO|nr:hypothetical protein MARPO_0138s0043 [Marchantia polymorpha]BBN08632.1 hypothetical protein Mp_4g13090 [Marchantia polymorpha subsp. ruderalis]|eukprot:PTQ29617.1 hypothetical protein MARPO_0138s0043 [Marchantia polymorpha]
MDALTQDTAGLDLKEEKYAASLSSILEARTRIQPYAHITPVLTCSSLDALAGRSLHFKCENFQKGGAFKFRGACNAVFSLPDEIAKQGVVTHSSGNHAAALALAAQIRGIPAHIVVPRNAPACKIANVERYGGKVVTCEPNIQSREETAQRVQESTGAVLVLPFNDGRVMSGQGTVAVEFLEQVPDLDAIFVPISGGGLTSGVALAAKALKPSIKIFAAEPKGADDAAQSKASGEIVTLKYVSTIADGLRTFLGNLTWPVVRDLVEDVITVSESEIVDAMKLCYERLKVVVEPSAVVGLAAVLSKKFQDDPNCIHCKNIGIVLTGGNVDLDTLWMSIKQNIQE